MSATVSADLGVGEMPTLALGAVLIKQCMLQMAGFTGSAELAHDGSVAASPPIFRALGSRPAAPEGRARRATGTYNPCLRSRSRPQAVLGGSDDDGGTPYQCGGAFAGVDDRRRVTR